MDSAAEHKPKLKRFVIYISEDKHRLLRAKLALKGQTVADWFREKAQEEINKEEP